MIDDPEYYDLGVAIVDWTETDEEAALRERIFVDLGILEL